MRQLVDHWCMQSYQTNWYWICSWSSKHICDSTWTNPLGCDHIYPYISQRRQGKNAFVGKGNLNFHGYCDGEVETRKPTYSYIYTLIGGAISALSTTEVEYISATEASKEAIWLTILCCELGLPKQIPVLHCDNRSAICLAKNTIYHARTKHIDIQRHLNREWCNPTSKEWYHRESGKLSNKVFIKDTSPTLSWESGSWLVE